MYINEIIRITYRCNWKCKFCNVLKTNNYWLYDISSKEVIYNILKITKKYTLEERKDLILSFSWWEPTLNKNLPNYIKLAKSIWVWNIQIQTNWSIIFSNFDLLKLLINSWLNEIFLAQHSSNNLLNKKMWCFTNLENFIIFLDYFEKNKLINEIKIYINIVINKINLSTTKEYINFLLKNNYFKLVNNNHFSFWFIQPNWYANINNDEVLLKYDKNELIIINELIKICEDNKLSLDFHFTSPPLCILNNPEYNLEYIVLNKLEVDKNKWIINKWNLDSYRELWKEKQKLESCKKCSYNKYCLWFYKNWISFVWEECVKQKIMNYI